MKRVTQDHNYMEGHGVAADTIIRFIGSTVYGTIEEAIKVKQELINNFENPNSFAYSREIPDNRAFDRNYAYNCGILDRLKEETDGTER